jgi:hypothetical protein
MDRGALGPGKFLSFVRHNMRKAVFAAVLLVLALLLAFGGGALVAVRSLWGTPIATVLVKNESERKRTVIPPLKGKT